MEYRIIPQRTVFAPARSKDILSKAGAVCAILTLLVFFGHQVGNKRRELVDFGLEGDYSGLRTLCKETKWDQDRTVWCAPIFGGFANVRNAALNCVRYSIATGSNLVEPTFLERDTNFTLSMEAYFDRQYFLDTLSEHCPQMKIRQEKDLQPSFHWDQQAFPEPYQIKDVYKDAGGTRVPSQPFYNEETKTFRADFDKVMASRGAARVIDGVTIPVLFRLQWPFYFSWTIKTDTPAFWTNFGKILRFRPEDIEVASEVHQALVAQHGPLYFGAHLRAEYDVAENMDFTRPAFQISNYIKMCQEKGLSTIYAAAGDEISLETLRQAAAQANIVVTNKYALLSPASLARLRSTRNFDQQALVDWLVLVKSTFFSGIGMSSFSADVAIRRHQLVSQITTFDLNVLDGVSQLLDAQWAERFTLTIYP